MKVKTICHSLENTEHRFADLINPKKAFLCYKQGPDQHVIEYFETMKELDSVLESLLGKVHDPSKATFTAKTNGARKEKHMRDQYLSTLLILNVYKQRFEGLLLELSNSFNLGRDEYPKTPTDNAKDITRTSIPATQQWWAADIAARGGGGIYGRNAVQVVFNMAQGKVDELFGDGIYTRTSRSQGYL
jgi:hypothetical protein